VATTPSASSKKGLYNEWDPDTPTLKAWARRELATSRNQLGRMGNESSEDEDNDEDDDNLDTIDTVGGQASKSICTTSLSSKDDDRSDSDVEDDGEEQNGEDGPRLRITRLSYRSAEDGRIYPAFNGMSDSSESDQDQREQPGGSESDLDDEGYNEELIERYYRVDDDEEVDGDDEEEIDEIYDDTS
jgi:hypothetical protein